MKKLITLAAFILLLTGCSSEKTFTSTVTDGNTLIATVGNAKITKQDLYECMMEKSGVDFVLNAALTQIASTAEIDQAAIDAEVQSTESTWKALLGDNIDSYTESYFGYKTFEEYKQQILVPSFKQMLMINNYSTENFDKLASQYFFVKCRLIIVDDQTTATEVLSKVTTKEMTFEDACEKYSTDSTNKSNKGEIGLVSDLSSCTADKNIVTILPQLTKKGMYSVPLQLSTGKYGVLEVVETDITTLKTEIAAQLKDAEEVIYEAEQYFLHENNFDITDKYLKEKMEARYPGYIK